ncbi:unnamed protein product [Natator depressus]
MVESHGRVKMAAVREEQFAALQILLKASSKDVVRQLCQECFSSSTRGSSKLIDSTCSNLSVTSEEAAQLVGCLHNLTRHIVYRGLSSAEEILSLFPENFHQSLKNLLTKIILENVSVWRSEAQSSQISLPRLVDMDWRVDIKTSSDSIGRMAVPTCLLQLKRKLHFTGDVHNLGSTLWSFRRGNCGIQEDAALCGDSPVISSVTVELNKETLDTMLDGLGRIRDQLSAVANK